MMCTHCGNRHDNRLEQVYAMNVASESDGIKQSISIKVRRRKIVK